MTDSLVANPRAIHEIEHCWIPLPDGTRLAAKIWLPIDAEEEPVPAILEYLPYRKRDGTRGRDRTNHPPVAEAGYACIRVDIRGTGDSEGVYHDEYTVQEQLDGCDVIAWIAEQPWCTGAVGIIGNGAGLVMSTLDVVAYAGEKHGGVKPANFLDIGGGASAEVMAAGLDVILGDSQVKSVFVNVFGGITSCDAVASGIVGALQTLGDDANKPLVVRLDGNNVEEGRRILAEANHPLVIQADTMDSGADKAAELANKN